MLGIQEGSLFGGRYKVIKSLGAGGMGAVYLAEDPRYEGFKVALKVIYPGILKSKEARERFRNEVLAAYRVNHPNIVRAYEYFDEGELQAFAMEYIDGGDLLDRIQAGKLSPEEVTSILRQVAAGLEAVHSQGILHRDLKPENIMLTREGIAKISDFGVARLRGASALTNAGFLVGTPKYLSPEYIESNDSDHRGDIYALGVMGYEMIAGVAPFRAQSESTLLVERFERKEENLQELAPQFPAELIKIVQKAMHFTVSLRYQNAGEMRMALEKVAQQYQYFSPDLVEESELIQKISERRTAVGKSRVLINGVPVEEFDRKHTRSKQPALIGAGMITVCLGILALWITLNHLLSPPREVEPDPRASIPTGVWRASDLRGSGVVVWGSHQSSVALVLRDGCAIEEVLSHLPFKCGAYESRLNPEIEPTAVVESDGKYGAGELGVLQKLAKNLQSARMQNDRRRKIGLALEEVKLQEDRSRVTREVPEQSLVRIDIRIVGGALKAWYLAGGKLYSVSIHSSGDATRLEGAVPLRNDELFTWIVQNRNGVYSSGRLTPSRKVPVVSTERLREEIRLLREERKRGADPELLQLYESIDQTEAELTKFLENSPVQP